MLRAETKLKTLPQPLDKLAYIPVLIDMIRRYINKEYTLAPIGTIISALAAIIYFVSPVDLLPDVLPAAGYIDDAVVLGVCLTLIISDDIEVKRVQAALPLGTFAQ